MKGIAKKLAKGKSVKIGFMADAAYPDGTPVATVAAIQNFGAPTVGIPPRPFFSNMIRDKSSGWGTSLGHQLKTHGMDAVAALEAAGSGVAGQLVQSIHDTNSPPLADATIKAKGFAKPLIDTGIMWQSVTSQVEG
ncbi:MAG: hypothetical protein KGP14_15160 [Betaproteobacteria bacterium]|nr:hypothetical protein [Betaproteobacteria bacterium]